MNAAVLLLLAARACAVEAAAPGGSQASVFSDFRTQSPGTSHWITPADLPPPRLDEDVDNRPSLVERPEGAWPKAPAGFKVSLFATGLDEPRQVRRAPNGDLFVAESGAGRVRVYSGVGPDGRPLKSAIFALGLRQPFGLAFYPPGRDPQWLYVGDTDAVVRFPYQSGELKALGRPEAVVKLPAGGHLDGNGHWTRDVAFSLDGKTLFVSVGSRSNVADVDDNPSEFRRADILACDPDGGGLRVYASGLRNPVSLAVDPATGRLWTTVNERDRLGDDLPPDYITHVEDGGFYGWPWYYIGGHPDPRHAGKHPELRDRVIVPDVLVQPHNASLGLTFYEGRQFPAQYRGQLFAAEHGSWNRAKRTGYELIRVFMKDGRASGAYEDFVTGFVLDDGRVWGRPVGVAEAGDGSLVFSDDASGSLWRVSYEGGPSGSSRSRRSARPKPKSR